MSGRSPRTIIGVAVMVVAVAGAVAAVVISSRPPLPPVPVAPVFPKPPEGHPVIPSPEEPTPSPPPAFCEARDIALVSGSLRRAHDQALAIAMSKKAEKKGAPATCHAADSDRDLSGAFDNLTKRTGACVAKDSELDSQWAQIDSAVLAYGRCIDCTQPRADRLIGCQRMLELVNSAEKSMR